MRYLALRSRTVAVVGLWVLAGALLVTAATPSEAQADCPSGYVALTFDDGPHGQHTLEVLDVLAAKSATGVFFVIGRSAAAYPDLLGRMAAEGHQVLNHTWSHANLTILSAAQIVGEIQHTADSIAAAESIIRRALPNPEAPADGAVLLLHDGLPRTSPTGHPTVAALPAIIDGLRERGFCFGHLAPDGAVVGSAGSPAPAQAAAPVAAAVPPDPTPEDPGPPPEAGTPRAPSDPTPEDPGPPGFPPGEHPPSLTQPGPPVTPLPPPALDDSGGRTPPVTDASMPAVKPPAGHASAGSWASLPDDGGAAGQGNPAPAGVIGGAGTAIGVGPAGVGATAPEPQATGPLSCGPCSPPDRAHAGERMYDLVR